MFELWKMKMKVEMYLKLLKNEPEEVKKELGFYIKEVVVLEQDVRRYIKKLENQLEKLDLKSTRLKEENSEQLPVMIKMGIVAYKIDRIYLNRGKAMLLQEDIKYLKDRINMFTYFKRP